MGQQKYGMNMVKIRFTAKNTNDRFRNITLQCKLIVYLKT